MTKIDDAIQELNSKFQYEKDGKIDVWRILYGDSPWRGDCEDYSLTLLWLLSDRNLFKFLLDILTFKYLMWYVVIKSNGEGHAIVKIDGSYYDNIHKGAIPVDKLQRYSFKYPIIFPLVYIRLLFSYTVGLLLK